MRRARDKNELRVSTSRGLLCGHVIVESANYNVTRGSLPRVFREFCRYGSSSRGDINVNLTLSGTILLHRYTSIVIRSRLKGKDAFRVEFCGSVIWL